MPGGAADDICGSPGVGGPGDEGRSTVGTRLKALGSVVRLVGEEIVG